MRVFASLALAVVLFCSGCAPGFLQPTPLIPREILFANLERTDPQISPDGKYLAYLAPDANNVMQIWLRPLAGQDERQLTSEKKRNIRHYTWAFDGVHLIFALDTDGDENWQIHTVNMQTGSVHNLTPYKGVQSLLLSIAPHQAEYMLIAMNLRNRRFYDVYRVNLSTGETRLVHRNGRFQIWWVPDSNWNVHVASTMAGVIARDSNRQPWRIVRRWQSGEGARFLGMSRDNKSLYIRGTHDRDVNALLAVDIESGNETVIAEDSKDDLEDVFIHPVTREIQAVAFYRDKLDWQVLDPDIAEDFSILAKVQKGTFNLLNPPWESPILFSKNLGRRDLQDRTWIVSYETDEGPIHHYAYDRALKKTTFLFSEQPKLEQFKLANMQPISYQSRDGLTIHGYLTLPVGIPAKNLPTVLFVHGGPWSRDRWGYYDIVQWLANRGYAVLQVNYRGSAGYGKNFLRAGYKEWGGKMQDDLIDGVQWLVKQGITEPKKVAIMGSSYGGYSTLAGLTLTPDVFAAGVSRVGISDLIFHYNNYPSYWSLYKVMFRVRVGDPQKEEELLKSRSPLFYVDQIKAPLLIAHGSNDARVVAAQSEQMVAAMRKADKAVEYLIYEDEGHREWKPESKFHFYAKAEEFLARYLGGRFEPSGNLTGHVAVER
jgi:dipeptidyl aminopeptidase/acylaminoacyl peptidase